MELVSAQSQQSVIWELFLFTLSAADKISEILIEVLIPCLFPGIIIYSLSDEFYLLLMSFTDRVPDQFLTSVLCKYLLVLNAVALR